MSQLSDLQRARERFESDQQRNKFCGWKESEFSEYNIWETDCKNVFNIIDGTPKENNMQFCCYCGKKLKQMVK